MFDAAFIQAMSDLQAYHRQDSMHKNPWELFEILDHVFPTDSFNDLDAL